MRVGIVPRIRGSKRRSFLKQHRLSNFERVFDKYIEGKTTAEHVAERGEKLKSINSANKRASKKRQKLNKTKNTTKDKK